MADQKRRFGWWRAFTRRYNALLFVTPVLLIPGMLLLVAGDIWPAWKDVAWLVGGALLAAGFSALVASVTGSQAIHEQYAKEANLHRKSVIYGPLHSELKALRKRFGAVQQQQLPYPQAIIRTGEQFSQPISQGRYPLPTLECWPQFRADYRRDNFTASAQQALEHLHQSVRNYNAAMEATREPTSHVLALQIAQAIREVITSEAYQRWWKENSVDGHLRQPPPSADTPHSWFGRIAEALSPNESPETCSPTLARWWLNTGGVHGGSTAALGWLLAKCPEHAALDIQVWMQRDGSSRQWDVTWLQAIFTATWNNLQSHAAYQAVWKIEESLVQQLGTMERELDAALRSIRDQYEGGEPLV